MTDNIISKQDKVISLFKFIEEMNKLRQKVILNVSEYNWFCPISTIPSDSENILLVHHHFSLSPENFYFLFVF